MAKQVLNQWKQILQLKIIEVSLKKCISYNDYIDSVIEVSGKFYIKKDKSILSRYNYVHCGVEILSVSKRIMNKVFSPAFDIGVKIYYQDTDSIHLHYDDVGKIVKRYKENMV